MPAVTGRERPLSKAGWDSGDQIIISREIRVKGMRVDRDLECSEKGIKLSATNLRGKRLIEVVEII